MTSVWEVLTFSQNFDLVDLAKENIGVFMQVSAALFTDWFVDVYVRCGASYNKTLHKLDTL